MKKILINFLILSFYSFGDGEAGSLSLDKDINEDRKISFPNTKEYLVGTHFGEICAPQRSWWG